MNKKSRKPIKKSELQLINFKVTPKERNRFNAWAREFTQGNLSELLRDSIKEYARFHRVKTR